VLFRSNFSILHQDESGVLLKKRLGKEGSDDKASKQLVSECARLSKRVFNLIDDFVKVIFVVKNDIPSLFLIESVSAESNIINLNVSEDVLFSSESGLIPEDSSILSNDFDLDNVVKKTEIVKEVLDVSSNNFDDSFDDSDEFIVQDEHKLVEEDSFSSFFKLISLLEEDILKMYTESFGFAPNSFEEAIIDLDNKHGFEDKGKILKVFEIKSLIMNGEKIDEDIIFSVTGIIEDFLKRDESC